MPSGHMSNNIIKSGEKNRADGEAVSSNLYNPIWRNGRDG